jgi:hypothetical protein
MASVVGALSLLHSNAPDAEDDKERISLGLIAANAATITAANLMRDFTDLLRPMFTELDTYVEDQRDPIRIYDRLDIDFSSVALLLDPERELSNGGPSMFLDPNPQWTMVNGHADPMTGNEAVVDAALTEIIHLGLMRVNEQVRFQIQAAAVNEAVAIACGSASFTAHTTYPSRSEDRYAGCDIIIDVLSSSSGNAPYCAIVTITKVEVAAIAAGDVFTVDFDTNGGRVKLLAYTGTTLPSRVIDIVGGYDELATSTLGGINYGTVNRAVTLYLENARLAWLSMTMKIVRAHDMSQPTNARLATGVIQFFAKELGVLPTIFSDLKDADVWNVYFWFGPVPLWLSALGITVDLMQRAYRVFYARVVSYVNNAFSHGNALRLLGYHST